MRKTDLTVRRRVAGWTVVGVTAAVVATPFALGAPHHRTARPPHTANRADDIKHALGYEQSVVAELKQTPPQYTDAGRHLDDALTALTDAAWSAQSSVAQALAKVITADERAKKLNAAGAQKLQIEVTTIQNTLPGKLAVIKEETIAYRLPTRGCTISYPVPIAAGESTIGISGCSGAVGSVKLTFPLGVAKVSSYGIATRAALDSGPCTKSANTVSCGLNNPWYPEGLFFVAVSPQLKPGERVTVDLTPSPSGNPWSYDFLVPVGPTLAASAMAKEHTAGETTPHTSFDLSVTVGGGPFQNIVINAPKGVHFGFTSQQKPTGGLTCGTQTMAGGGQRTICTPPAGELAVPPGTYRFGVNFATPLGPSTTLTGSVAGAGVGAPKAFVLKTGR